MDPAATLENRVDWRVRCSRRARLQGVFSFRRCFRSDSLIENEGPKQLRRPLPFEFYRVAAAVAGADGAKASVSEITCSWALSSSSDAALVAVTSRVSPGSRSK